MNWLRENWLLVIIFFIFFVLPLVLPFFYKYPTKGEHQRWKDNLGDEKIEDYMYEQRDGGEFYAP